jgi:hypothetical protein
MVRRNFIIGIYIYIYENHYPLETIIALKKKSLGTSLLSIKTLN